VLLLLLFAEDDCIVLREEKKGTKREKADLCQCGECQSAFVVIQFKSNEITQMNKVVALVGSRRR